MSLAGKLEDVPLADVMQFIHLGRRTGTLSLQRGSELGEITFHHGAIVGARSPASRKIGELLLEEGILEQADLDDESRQALLVALNCPCCGAGGMNYTAPVNRKKKPGPII